jgi:hypothetical protein
MGSTLSAVDLGRDCSTTEFRRKPSASWVRLRSYGAELYRRLRRHVRCCVEEFAKEVNKRNGPRVKPEQMIEQLKGMPDETQSAPEFQKLLAELESPAHRLSAEDLAMSHISAVSSTAKERSFRKAWRWLLVVGELVAMIALLYHLYTYADTSLSALKVGEVADIIVSVVVFCLLGLALYRTRR